MGTRSRGESVLGGDLPKPHNHALSELPLGIGPGRLARLVPGTNVTFTSTGEVGTFAVNAVAGGGGGLRQFVWNSGGPTNAAEGRFGTFAGAHAAAAAAVAAGGGWVRLLAVGDAVTNSATIETPNTYDMTLIEFVGQSGNGGEQIPNIGVPDGTEFINPARMSNMVLNYAGAAALINVATSVDPVTFEWGPDFQISPTGGGVAGTILTTTGSGGISLYLNDNTFLAAGDTPGGRFAYLGDTSLLDIVCYSRTQIASDLIEGDPGSSLAITREGSSVIDDQTTYGGVYTGPVAGAIPYVAGTQGWDFVTGGIPPVTTGAAIDLLLESRTLFGAPFDPQNVLSVSQGSIQPTMGATPATGSLVATGLMASPTLTSPVALSFLSGFMYVARQTTLAVAGSVAAVQYAGSSLAYRLGDGGTRYSDTFSVVNWGFIRLFTGLIADTTLAAVQSDSPAPEHVALQFSSSRGDTAFQISVRTGASTTLIDTGIAPVSGRFYRLDIVYTGSFGDTYLFLWDLTNGLTNPLLASSFAGAVGPANGTYFSGIEAQGAFARTIDRAQLALQQRGSLLRPLF